MNEGLINLLKHRVAEGAIGPSALRNQENTGVLSAVRLFLKSVDLFDFSIHTEQQFKAVLDAHTKRLKRFLPEGARHWGAARNKSVEISTREIVLVDWR